MPRDWPPASVWLLTLSVFSPAAGLVLRGAWSGETVALCVGVILLVSFSPVGVCLVCGQRVGLTAIDGLVGLVVLGWCGIVVTVVVQLGWQVVGMRAFQPFAWAVTVFSLRWWPETRRWCGVLPPPEPEDDG